MERVGRDPRVRIGRGGEGIAEAFLRRKGYRLLARRFRLRDGEIDLVMDDSGTIVFVEVRRRRSERLGDPLESIGWVKRARLIHAARVFLHRFRRTEAACRFDVVAIRDVPGGEPAIEHRIDAFRADG